MRDYQQRISTASPTEVCLLILTTLAIGYTLYIAKILFLPIVLALLARFTCMPILRAMQRFKISTILSAFVVILFLTSVFALGVKGLIAPAQIWINTLPEKIEKLEAELINWGQPLREVQATAERLEKLTESDSSTSRTSVSPQETSITKTLLSGGTKTLSVLSSTMLLLFFLLAYGDRLIESIVARMTTPSRRASLLECFKSIEGALSTYLFTIAFINCALAASVAAVLYAIGFASPIFWGAVTGILNFVPYIGPLVACSLILVESLLVANQPLGFLAPAACVATLTVIEGCVVTPLIVGRRFTLNPILILGTVVFWAWLWGPIGGLIAVPLLVCGYVVVSYFRDAPENRLVKTSDEFEAAMVSQTHDTSQKRVSA